MLNMIDLMKDVHENAVAHGWWETKRQEASVRALIVSEWAEALEEDRAGRPMVWHACKDMGRAAGLMICKNETEFVCKTDSWEQDCHAYDKKPEGIAVELMDGCIRILDYLGYVRFADEFMPETMEAAVRCGKILIEKNIEVHTAETIPTDVLVDELNYMTMQSRSGYGLHAYVHAMCMACAWVQAHGVCPETLIQKKHRYNKTRAYKHGKKY